jgi:O-antigen/teichoic acid export membrane protein
MMMPSLPAVGIAAFGKWFVQARGSDLLRKIGGTLSARGVVIALGLGNTIMTARLLGPEGRGLFFAATTIMVLGTQFGHFGLVSSNIYYVARDRTLVPNLVSNSVAVVGTITGLALVLGIVGDRLAPDWLPVRGTLLLLSAVGAGVSLLYLLSQSLLIGVGRIRAYNIAEIGVRLAPLLMLGVFWMLGWLTPEWAMAATIGGVAFGAIFSVAVVLNRRLTRVPLPSPSLLRAHMAYGLRAYFATLFAFGVQRVGVLIVAERLGADAAGYYSLGCTFVELLSTPASVAALLIFAHLSSLIRPADKWRMAVRATWLTCAGTAAVSIIVAPLVPLLVRLVFGARFLPATEPILLMLPAVLFTTVQLMLAQYIASIGLPLILVAAWGGVLAASIAASLGVGLHYGVAGMAVTYSASYLVLAILTLTIAYRLSPRKGTEADPTH